ncbi:MAG TPA: CoA-binding protein [Candidatus Limnocylindrales bacterium]
MPSVSEVADEFLSHKRFAVTGVSRTPKSHGGNVIYTRLRDRGYQVFAVNPNADKVEGDTSYHDLKSIPGGVDVVVIATRPEHAEATVREAGELGITRIWTHRMFGAGSCSAEAADVGRAQGMTVIDGGCPLMFGDVSDGGHRMLKMFGTWMGKVPRKVEVAKSA